MDPSNPVNLIITGIYYILTVMIAFFSIFGVYVLLRYGRSRTVSLSISILYSIVFLALLQLSYSTLHNL